MRHITLTKFIILFITSLLVHEGAYAQVTTQTFNCTGANQTFTVPGCVTSITVEAWGGAGGGGGWDSYQGSPGGGGAYATSVIAVVPGQVLTVITGCGGTQGGACAGSGPGGPGGFGLGNGGVGGNSGGGGCSGPGGGGGGGTGIQNGGTILLVAGGGGGGGGGGNNGGGAAGGGGGVAGSASTSAPGGILGASGSTIGLSGASTAGDGAGGGGGGGGLNGGGGGQVPGSDNGGSGGAGGTSQGTTINNGAGQTPGNSGSANLCAGCAVGGIGAINGGVATPGANGEMVISYTTPTTITGTITSTSGCASATATISASGGTPGYTYTWSPSGGNAATTTGLTAGNYTVNIADANGCMGTATTTITLPPSFSGTIATGAGACGLATATVSPTGGTPGYTYTWSPSGGNGVTASLANGNYTVTITDALGCTGTATTSVVLPPALTLTAVQTNVTCNGLANGSATATASAGTGPYTYAWAPGPPQISITGIATGLSGATTYTVGVQDAAGCQDTLSMTITQPAVLNQTLTVTTPICVGASSPFNDAVSGGTAPYTVTWSSGGSFVGAAGTTTVSPITTTTYSASVLDFNNCANTATATVVVNPLPVIAVNSASICVGGSTILNANGAISYTWSPATGLSATSGNSVTANPAATTNYIITGSDINNCVNTGTATVTVNAPPVIVVNSATICIGSSTTLTASLTSGGAATYTWSPTTGLSSTSGSTVTANPIITTPYTITGSNGCVSSTTATVTVNPLPTVTASSGTICPTFSVTLNAGGAVTYVWNTGATTPSVTLSPNTTTTYTVVGTDANTCSSFTTATITVHPALVLTIGGNTPICQGATLNLTTSPGVAWAWLGPLAYASNLQNPTIINAQPNMSGTYSVAAQDINGCADTAFINITVNPLPLPVASNNSAICANQTLNFTGNSPGGGTYVWTGPNSYSVTTQNPSVANAPVGISGIYTLTVTDLKNCVNTDTTLVIVNPLPAVTVNSATICIGSAAVLTANNATGTYTWTPSTGLSASLGSPVTATPTTTTSYSVTGINLTGCSTTVSCTVVVNPLPNIIVNSGTICAGKNTTLQALGANTYTWSPGTGLNTTTGSSVTASPPASATYVVTGADIHNCINTATSSVHVNPLPVVNISPLVTSGCEPLCVAFSNANPSTLIYKWNFDDGNTDNISAPTHCFSKGTFSVSLQVTDSNGCVNTSSANVIAFPKPQANFYATPQPTTILDPLIHFYDGTGGGATIATWNWNFGDNLGISLTQNPSYTYQDTGTFAVQLAVISNLGCKDSIIVYVTIEDEYLIYVPNAFSPNSDGTNDVFMPKGEGVTEYKLYVYDRWGKLVFSTTDLLQGWDGRLLNKGNDIVQEDTYVWKIEAKNKRGQPKLLKGVVSLLK